jgi:hypothetical protein
VVVVVVVVESPVVVVPSLSGMSRGGWSEGSPQPNRSSALGRREAERRNMPDDDT